MAYSTNPYLPRARAIALKLLLQDGLPSGVVARKCGIHRTTLYRWRRKWDELNMNMQRDNPRRPQVTAAGELVQTDTIHHVDPSTGRRLCYYTVIDLFTRMTHVILAPKLSPGLAAQAVLQAQATWGFTISMVQADNSPEYGRYFARVLNGKGVAVRHSRLHRPNDNAHIERFNRTIQEECIGSHWRKSVPLSRQQQTLNTYLDYYNNQRVHLGIQLRTPTEMLQRS